jgi:L-lactate utilization protein LutB
MTADPTETWRAALASAGQSASARLAETQAALAASQADLTHMQEQRDKALRLLEYALHLRMHGENAPGGNETWAQFDRDAEAFLRRLNEKEGKP